MYAFVVIIHKIKLWNNISSYSHEKFQYDTIDYLFLQILALTLDSCIYLKAKNLPGSYSDGTTKEIPEFFSKFT